MSIATLTSQNQITIPSNIRRILNLKAGDKIKFFSSPNQEVKVIKIQDLTSLQGIFRSYNRRQEYDPHSVWTNRATSK